MKWGEVYDEGQRVGKAARDPKEAADIEAEWVWGTTTAPAEAIIYEDGNVLPALGYVGARWIGVRKPIPRHAALRLLGICAEAGTAEPFFEVGVEDDEQEARPWRAAGTRISDKMRWMLHVFPHPEECFLYSLQSPSLDAAEGMVIP